MRLRRWALAPCWMLVVGAASGQITGITEFPGELAENFEDKMRAGDCIAPRIFEGTADLCSGAPLISKGWGTTACRFVAHEGTVFVGSATGALEYSFDRPVRRFGGYFGQLFAGDDTVEFYDAGGALLGSAPLGLSTQCTWHWRGWQSDQPVTSIIVRGSGTGEFVMMDAMRIDLFDTMCYPDCDVSGSLNIFDFLCFQNAFAAGEPSADCDGSGAIDFADFLCYQAAFAAGCP
ncbi:MAG: GC-type dockerin domain-anchored protein [Phycisphaerales bacterium JB039]